MVCVSSGKYVKGGAWWSCQLKSVTRPSNRSFSYGVSLTLNTWYLSPCFSSRNRLTCIKEILDPSKIIHWAISYFTVNIFLTFKINVHNLIASVLIKMEIDYKIIDVHDGRYSIKIIESIDWPWLKHPKRQLTSLQSFLICV